MPYIISRDQDKVTSYHGGGRVYFPKLKLKIHAVRVCVYIYTPRVFGTN
jgi:hypothetical protein